MNSLKIKAYKLHGPIWFLPFVKMATLKNPIEFRQFFLISRIMISIFTIGLMGHTMDRVMKFLQKL
jgi:hypothetical protein